MPWGNVTPRMLFSAGEMRGGWMHHGAALSRTWFEDVMDVSIVDAITAWCLAVVIFHVDLDPPANLGCRLSDARRWPSWRVCFMCLAVLKRNRNRENRVVSTTSNE